MTFEYRDDHQLTLRITRLEPDYPGQTVTPAIWIETSDGFFSRTAVKVPAARVEEVVAGIRDAARTATARQTGQQPDLPPWHADGRHGPTPEEAAAGLDASQSATDQAHPAVHRWAAELYDPDADEWVPGTRYSVRDRALNHLAHARKVGPTWKDGTPVERRLVRETTTWTVEDGQASQPEATDPLVHVGWWCWRGDNHGHLATTACRSDNVPLHVPAEWADEMRAVIQHLTDDHDPGEDCTWLSPEDQVAETFAAADTEETDQ